MNISVPKQLEHRIYKNTFLQSTQVEIQFSQITEADYNDQLKSDVNSMLYRFFNKEQSDYDLLHDGIGISNKDHGIFYGFAPNKAIVKIDRNGYRSFLESVLSRLLPIKFFSFEVLHRQYVTNVAVRKVNIFSFTADNKETVKRRHDTILGQVFSTEFIKSPIDESKKKDHIIGNMDLRILNDGDISVVIRSGISPVVGKTNQYNIVLDSVAYFRESREIQEGSIDRELLKLNDKLYDVYLWAINDNIKELMNKNN